MEYRKWVVYNLETGRIIHSSANTLNALPFSSEGQGVVEVAPEDFDLNDYWVDNGEFKARVPFPALLSKTTIVADDIDSAVISNIPEGAEITIDGTNYTITGGSLEITSPVAATYNLSCSHWPYLDWETNIEAITE